MRFLVLLFMFVFLAPACGATQKPTIKEQLPEEKPAVVEENNVGGLKLAPDFKLEDLNQNTFTLSSYKDKQAVLLFFWTTWCPYCRMEFNKLTEEYPQLTKAGWELLAINVGEPSYRVEGFLKSRSLSFKVLLDRDARVSESYDILGVPTYVLVDKKGYIVFEDNYFPKGEYRKLVSE